MLYDFLILLEFNIFENWFIVISLKIGNYNVVPSSPALSSSAPGIVILNPGIVILNPGIVILNPGIVILNPGIVILNLFQDLYIINPRLDPAIESYSLR